MKYILFLMLALANSSCDKNLFGAGSNIDAERYKINSSKEELLEAIFTLKKENPEYCPPLEKYDTVHVERVFTYIDFYLKERARYIGTFVQSTNTETIFGLVSISAENPNDPWLIINDNLEGSENEAVKREFEERILNPIKEILARGK